MKKKVIRDIVLVVLAVMGVLFAVIIFFGNSKEGNNNIFAVVGEGIGPISQESYVSDIASEIDEAVSSDIPIIRYVGGTRMVGDEVLLADLFEVEYEDGTIIRASDDENTVIYLVDIRDSSNNIIVETLTTEDIESLEEIPAAFIYDAEQKILYFHKSGVFTVYIKVYSGSGSGVLCEFLIPVEVE